MKSVFCKKLEDGLADSCVTIKKEDLMVVQLEQLNELLQKKVENVLKERNLNQEDIQITVNGAKIEIIVVSTHEVLKF